MIIHVVQPGETLQSIAGTYTVSAERLIIENGITNPDNLVVGQTIVIVQPKITYTIQEGDTLKGIAQKNNVTVMQILQNNPFLSNRDYLYPGETIVISYDTDKIGKIVISGYAYPFIGKEVLKKTLPYLTYLTIFNYRITRRGTLVDIHDEEIIELAKAYGVAPMMLVSTLDEFGTSSGEIANIIYSNPDVQNELFDNAISIMKKKGYCGLNMYLQYLRPENRTLVEEYVRNFSIRLREEGFRIIATITPRTTVESTGVLIEEIDYSNIAKYVDGMLLLTYSWGFSYEPPTSVTPVNVIKNILNYVVSLVPPDKLFLGLPIIGYDWQLPYIPGISKANAITNEGAIQLALENGVAIQYAQDAEAPYFYYIRDGNEIHVVWFKDARSIDAITNLVTEYNLQGTGIWNIMNYFAQMWFVINVKYEIIKLPFWGNLV